jgi:hypothetical protein
MTRSSRLLVRLASLATAVFVLAALPAAAQQCDTPPPPPPPVTGQPTS